MRKELLQFPKRFRQAGMTLLELIIACAILMILASAAMPVARYTVQRRKEAELHSDLREMRDAIDRYKDAADRNLIRVEVGTEGYPPDLDTLVKGVDMVSQPNAAGIAGATNPGQPIAPSTGPRERRADSALRIRQFRSGFGSSGSGFGSFWVRVRRLERIGQRFRTIEQLRQQLESGAGSGPARSLSSTHPRRSHDRQSRLGNAFGAGRSRFDKLGRQERVRRFFQVHEHLP